MIHKEKSHFPFCATAHRVFKIFKKAVLDFCGEQSLAEASLGRSMDCSFLSFMGTVHSETVGSFCITIHTQKQWENKMALLLECNSILQDILTLALWFVFALWIMSAYCLSSIILVIMAICRMRNSVSFLHRAEREVDGKWQQLKFS